MDYRRLPPGFDIPYNVAAAIQLAAIEIAKGTSKAFRVSRRESDGAGSTLRPGRETPLWNELREQLKPHLKKRGNQANLGRLLGLPRQRINSFVTGGGQMPDAERTLQLLAWLMAVRSNSQPA